MDELLEQMMTDGMRLRTVRLPTKEVVFFKSILEAYPGLASIHAPPGRQVGGTAELVVACPAGAEREVDGMLQDLCGEMTLRLEPRPPDAAHAASSASCPASSERP